MVSDLDIYRFDLRGFIVLKGALSGDSVNELNAVLDEIPPMKPGDWQMGIGGFGEILPYHENKMTLDYDKKDQWDLPTITFDATLKENELKMRKDILKEAKEMLENAGFRDVIGFDREYGFGLGIHEMGTARMGRDPKTSILNCFNQIHSVSNVYVTDGAAMTSSGNQNPSLTYMALTARAANHAVNELKKMANYFENF